MDRLWRQRLLLVAALLPLVLAAGCAGGDGQPEASPTRQAATAPPQRAARIVAVRRRGNPVQFALVTARDDGSDVRTLFEAPAGGIQRPGAPAWSPDASLVYFVGVGAEREGDRFTYFESDVFVIDASGGDPRRITSSRDVLAAAPSPDGETLLITRAEHPAERPFTTGLWLTDPDGTNERRLLEPEDGRIDFAGSWSPDGGTIAFTRCSDTAPDQRGFIANPCAVYTVSRDGSGLAKLAERSSQPAFAPDGAKIAFVSDRDEHGKHRTGSDEEQFANELYVMDADGAHQRRLTNSEALDESSPAWSPNGVRLVFAREGPALFTRQLMVIDADGTCLTRMLGDVNAETGGEASYESPAWRPGRVTGKLAPLAC